MCLAGFHGLLEFIHEEDHPDINTRLERRRAGMKEKLETRFRKRGGSPLWTEAAVAPILDDKGVQ